MAIEVTPNPAFSGVGLTLQLQATGTYADASTANITALTTWTSSHPAVATVEATTGLASGIALGSTAISATIGSITATTPLSIVTGVWSPTGSLSTARDAHTATLLPNGKVLVAGGSGITFGPSFSEELFDPVAGTWSPTGSPSTGRSGHIATLLPNGKVLVAGGVGGGQVLSSAELYDPVAETWSPTGSLSAGRYSHTSTLLPSGQVLVVGGTQGPLSQFQDLVLISAELYDPVAGTWSPTGSLSTPRHSHTATLLPNGHVLVVGGTRGPATKDFQLVLISAEVYDPTAGTWSPTGSLAVARYRHTATLLPNGKVLVAGGTQDGKFHLHRAEHYDPIARIWSPTGSLTTGRSSHTATLLTNGKVLVAGGDGNSGSLTLSLSSAELHDPVAGIWSPTGSFLNPHGRHTATLLPNGVVLVAGGGSVDASTAELYW